ncbi:MAG: DUF2066 domain-containing protein [Proteobacteria bacterium]|nr:DUF2066 domain-containing protein [Pseudomonadota bacterium]MDA1291542.1 DUF2066 domain-containing protein [Pseudomonadota bacterium]
MIYSIIPPMIAQLKQISLYSLMLLTLLLISWQPSVALQVSGLYSQQIPVTNDGEAERNRAFREALAAVVVKVSGDPRWLENPAIERAIAQAQNYVEATTYISELIQLPLEDNTASADTDEEQFYTTEQRIISVNFAAAFIDELLADADIPVWDGNRPSVLVWMVLQSSAGDREFLTADSNPEIVKVMQDFAVARGLPIIFPVLDFEDRRTLSENTAWNLDEAAISSASERYGADSILAGRLHFTASGELVGLWQFQFQDEADVFDGFDSELQSYLYEPLNRITTQLAGYFAILPESIDGETIRLRIDGIKNLNAYSALLNYVENLGLVAAVTTAEVDGERIELQLSLVGDTRQLYEQIALDRDLVLINNTLEDSSLATLLHYRWTR